MLTKNRVKQVKMKLKEICVSEEISVSYDKWSEEYLLNSCVSEICVKRIHVNQGLGVLL